MTKRIVRLSLLLVFVVVCAFAAHAQSGRRKAPPPPAAPIPTPTPEPTPVAREKVERQADIGFIVGMDRGGALGTYPISFYDVVQAGCAERLRNASPAWVELVRDEMHRAEALKRAKEEPVGHVIWLQLTTTAMGSPSSQNYNDIEIEYVVYAPGTGKTVTSGRGYQNANRKGPLVVAPPIGTNNAMVREQLLKMAAEDVADRILKALKVPTTK